MNNSKFISLYPIDKHVFPTTKNAAIRLLVEVSSGVRMRFSLQGLSIPKSGIAGLRGSLNFTFNYQIVKLCT